MSDLQNSPLFSPGSMTRGFFVRPWRFFSSPTGKVATQPAPGQSPDVWNEIQRQFATGSFASHDAVLREALAALRFREEEVLALQEGTDDMEAGRVMPLRELDR